MQSLLTDLRLAVRSLRKHPVLTATVMVTLGLGLGANAAIFACIDALVLRPFTFSDVDRIVMIAEETPREIDRQESVAPGNFLDWKRQSSVFSHLAACDWWNANLGRDEAEPVLGFKVSADFFQVLGVQPETGRAFVRDEEVEGRHRVVVLGHGLWERRFGADPAIVGRTVTVDGLPHVVIGIAPTSFDFPNGAELWAPIAFDGETAANRRSRYLTVFGRLATGKTLDDAQTQMSVIAERLTREHPDVNRDRNVRVYTLTHGMLDVGLGPILSLWQAAAGFVLLIACANITNLLLARGTERQREVAVRLAIGASRGRVLRGLLVESVVLAGAAVPISLLVSWIGISLIRGYLPARIARFVAGWHTMDVDGRLVAFTALAAMATGVLFGVLPAMQTSRARLAEVLKEGGRSSSAGRRRQRARRALVVAEIALALPLLVAAALSVISAHKFLNGPQGYNPDGLVTMRVVLAQGRYPDDASRRVYVERALRELRALPGVTSAAFANTIPGHGSSPTSFEIEGQPHQDPKRPPSVDQRRVTSRYFETAQMPVLKGRGLTDADRDAAQPIAVISESMAERYWPSGNAIGSRIRLGTDTTWLTIVGISGDVIHNWFSRRNHPTVYRPFDQAPTGFGAMLVRTAGNIDSAVADVRAAMRRVDPAQPVSDLMSMRALLHDRTIGLQYIAGIMGVFAGLAFILALVGVYAVMAYLVSQQSHEIGVRVALGATTRDVMHLTLGHALRITCAGVAVGVALSLALTRFVEAALLGVASSDLRVLAGLAGTLVAAALGAAYFPARRASKVDPALVLRAE